jgi:hypothetical protein
MSFAETLGKRVVNSGTLESLDDRSTASGTSPFSSTVDSVLVFVTGAGKPGSLESTVRTSGDCMSVLSRMACRACAWLSGSGQGDCISVDATAEPLRATRSSSVGMLVALQVTLFCGAFNVLTGPPGCRIS